MPARSSRFGTGTIAKRSGFAINATFAPGCRAGWSRSSFGIEISKFEETVAIAGMRFTFVHRSPYSQDSLLRQLLQARADERGGLGFRSKPGRNLGHCGGGLGLSVAEADEGED